MRKTTFFQEEQAVWLKGNLHTHSTNSDGHLTPKELVFAYKNKGYDFMAVTDHDIFIAYPELSQDDFVLIPGFELTGPLTKEKNGHFCVLQKGSISDFTQGEKFEIKDREETIAFLERHHENNIIILNHPYWSLLEWEEVINLPYLTCMEVYNHASEKMDFVGEASHFWNTMLRKGKNIWGSASDDNHNGGENEPGWPFDFCYCDSFGGWIQVKAKNCSREGIIEAIEQGSFYASTGPEIYDFYVEDGIFHVECSPCQSIIISGDWGYFQRKIGDNLTEFSKKLKGKEKFIRVQCMDKFGRMAYSNPIYMYKHGQAKGEREA